MPKIISIGLLLLILNISIGYCSNPRFYVVLETLRLAKATKVAYAFFTLYLP